MANGASAVVFNIQRDRLGKGKYEALDRAYPLEAVPAIEPEQIESGRLEFEKLGVRCLVSRWWECLRVDRLPTIDVFMEMADNFAKHHQALA